MDLNSDNPFVKRITCSEYAAQVIKKYHYLSGSLLLILKQGTCLAEDVFSCSTDNNGDSAVEVIWQQAAVMEFLPDIN